MVRIWNKKPLGIDGNICTLSLLDETFLEAYFLDKCWYSTHLQTVETVDDLATVHTLT